MSWLFRVLIGFLVLITLFVLFMTVCIFIPGTVVDAEGNPLSAGERAPLMVMAIFTILLFVVLWWLTISLYKDMKEYL